MVSGPLNFKNPLAESYAERAKSRKDFAKKNFERSLDTLG
jgi:hypothetical protein